MMIVARRLKRDLQQAVPGPAADIAWQDSRRMHPVGQTAPSVLGSVPAIFYSGNR